MVIRRQTTERTKRPRSKGPPRRHRIQTQKDTSKLCAWVQRRDGLPEAPSINSALAGKHVLYSRNDAPNLIDCDVVAAEIIPTIRPLESLEPCLLTGRGRRTVAGSRNADDEFERRNVERRLLQELSRYYPLEQGQNAWSRSSLLSLGKHGCDRSTYDDLPLT